MNYCLYHANCKDGFGAAYAVWKEYGYNMTYIPAQYGQELPEMNEPENVYIVDFSYPKEIIEELRSKCKKLIVIDHHETAKDNGIDIYDITKSGAVLTWEYLFPDRDIPKLLLYIQDRDLWKWELPFSREVSAGLDLVPLQFEEWKHIDLETLYNEGKVVLKYQKQLIERLMKGVFMRTIGEYTVPMVNSSLFQSELGEKMLEEYPEMPFVGVFSVREKDEIISLRSRKGEFHVGEFAKQFGGGGHQAAAGVKTVY